MRKKIAWVLTLMMLLTLASALAEETGDVFSCLDGVEWSFSSGAGGWSTDMRFFSDGSFAGEYHDSEMGEYADAYPNGTLYCCSFTGVMSMIKQIDENTWKIRVDELKVDENQEAETIDEGIRFVFSEPYGLSEGDEMVLYQPGSPVDGFTDDMRIWAHLLGTEESVAELEYWFLYSEANDSGFVGFPVEPEAPLS